MLIDSISSGAHGVHNEDLVSVFQNEWVTDILVLDGATSVAERDYTGHEGGDVAWFVQRFSACLGTVLDPDRTQDDSVVLALHALRQQFRDQTAGVPIPVYARPIAALTWLRIGGGQLQLYCLGDCKTLLQRSDGTVVDLDPYVNPQEQVLQAHLRALGEEGVVEPAARRERLLPILRERRVLQNTAARPEILCLDPRGALAARHSALPLPSDGALLAMTDGFFRMVDTYAMFTPAELAEACMTRGLGAMLTTLRAYEAARGAAGGQSVKQADDASAVSIRLSPAAQ